MWQFVVDNTIYAATMALLIKAASLFPWAQRRPALVNLAWTLVLLRLVTPAFVAIPCWTQTEHANHFRSVDSQILTNSLSRGLSRGDETERSNLDETWQELSGSYLTAHDMEPTLEVRSATEQSSSLSTSVMPVNLTPWKSMQSLVAIVYLWGLITIWLLGSSVYMLILWRQHMRLARIIDCGAMDPRLTSLANEVAARMGCSNAPSVISVPAHMSPALIGVLRPMIVMPQWALRELSAEGLQAVLAHELAHLRRSDHLTAGLAIALRIIWWWHPLALWANREWRQWRELSCDALVLSSSQLSAKCYGQTLWSVAKHLETFPSQARPALAVTSGTTSFFVQRFRMLSVSQRIGNVSTSTACILVLLAFVALCYPTVAAIVRPPHAFQYSTQSTNSDALPTFVEAQPGWPTSVRAELNNELNSVGPVMDRFHFWFGTSDRPVLVAILASQSTQGQAAGQIAPHKLYVDTDRNERFEPYDLVEQISENNWTASVATSPASSTRITNQPKSKNQKQTNTPSQSDGEAYEILIRRDGGSLSVANRGHLHGKIQWNQQTVSAMIEDRNCNGLWTDSDDRLHIDWNEDGKFNALRERFSCQGSPNIQGQRYALAFVDDCLSLKVLEGTGRLSATVTLLYSDAEVTKCSAVLASADGIHVTINALNETMEIPIGRYSVKELRLGLKDDRVWSLIFEQDSNKKGTTVDVEKNKSTTIDLLGALKLSAKVNRKLDSDATLEPVIVQPMLHTTTGMYLSRCTVGKTVAQDDNTLTAALVHQERGQRKLTAIESTGFGCGAFCPITFTGKELSDKQGFIELSFDSGPLAGMMIETVGAESKVATP